MFWSFLFVVGIVQGAFLFTVFTNRNNGNRTATRLLQALLVLFALSNFDDLLLSTGWYKIAPGLFGYSMGAIFAYGPLFYLYIQSITRPSFSWKRLTGLHFLPALIAILLNLSWLRVPAETKIRFLDLFVAGKLPVSAFAIAFSLIQILHFAGYIGLAFRTVRQVRAAPETAALQLSLKRRIAWLRTWSVLFYLILLALIGLLARDMADGHYIAKANFVFTVLTSAILYIIAYTLILNPELVTPGFSMKQETIRFGQMETQELMLRIQHKVEVEKIYTDPDLSLGALAVELNIAPHRLSKFINDTYGRSFSDFINQYRVDAFITKLNDPRFAHYSLHGLALEVGFNTKSAFNAAFKKLTGKTPSAFKHPINDA